MAHGKALVALDLPGEYDDEVFAAMLTVAMAPFEDDTEAYDEDDTPDDGKQRIWESYEAAGMLSKPLPEAIADATAIITPNGDWINRATWGGPRPDFDAEAFTALVDHPAAMIAIITYRT